MSIYDILMLLVLGGAIFIGWWKGFAWQIASLVSIFLSYFVALNFRGILTPMITVEEPWNEAIAMFGLFLATALVVWIVFGFIRKNIEKLHLKTWDRQAGAIVGFVKGSLICILITFFAVTILGEQTKVNIVNSRSGRLITGAINRLAVAVPSNIREKIDSYLIDYNNTVNEHHDPNHVPAPISFPGTNGQFVGSVTTGGPAPTGQIYFDSATQQWVQVVPPPSQGQVNQGQPNNSNGIINQVGDAVWNAARDSITGNQQQ